MRREASARQNLAPERRSGGMASAMEEPGERREDMGKVEIKHREKRLERGESSRRSRSVLTDLASPTCPSAAAAQPRRAMKRPFSGCCWRQFLSRVVLVFSPGRRAGGVVMEGKGTIW